MAMLFAVHSDGISKREDLAYQIKVPLFFSTATPLPSESPRDSQLISITTNKETHPKHATTYSGTGVRYNLNHRLLFHLYLPGPYHNDGCFIHCESTSGSSVAGSHSNYGRIN